MKESFYSSNSSNLLEFDFDQVKQELNVSFTGTPTGNLIFSTEDINKVNTIKQYLNHRSFKYMKSLKNCLDFNSLEIVLSTTGHRADILTKEELPNRFMREKRVYLPNSKDMILWIIFTAKDFDLNKFQKEILVINSASWN